MVGVAHQLINDAGDDCGLRKQWTTKSGAGGQEISLIADVWEPIEATGALGNHVVTPAKVEPERQA
jgi:hypothetical protein